MGLVDFDRRKVKFAKAEEMECLQLTNCTFPHVEVTMHGDTETTGEDSSQYFDQLLRNSQYKYQ